MLTKGWNTTGDQVSILGFGAMRLPVTEEGKIDEPKAIKMIRQGIDGGINYLDTAWPYHGGQSEEVCAKVMKDGYREKVFIATKLPSWELNADEDMMRILDEQLAKLEVDYIDYYLLHALNEDFWSRYKRFNYKEFIAKAKAQGKIRHIGFSFHDKQELFFQIIDDYDWDFCQIQMNYMDKEYQAGEKGLVYAHEKGIPVIIMEPLRGGLLAKEPPKEIAQLMVQSQRDFSPAEWALRYLWDREEVSLILSGMSLPEQVEENVKIARQAGVGNLSDKDRQIISRFEEVYNSRLRVNCTSCGYCMPCPSGVNIPQMFSAYNRDSVFDDFEGAKDQVMKWHKPEERPSACTECGICVDKCPQNIDIPQMLKKVGDLLEVAS